MEYLYLDTENLLRIQPSDMVGKRAVVLGSTGSGKSYTVAVIADALPQVQLRMDTQPLTAELAAKVALRESEAQKRVMERQEINLKKLAANVQALPPFEQEVLYFLSRRADKQFIRAHIVNTLHIPSKRLSMPKLVATGLVGCDKRYSPPRFSFRADWLKDKFPDLDQDYVLGQVILGVEEKTA